MIQEQSGYIELGSQKVFYRYSKCSRFQFKKCRRKPALLFVHPYCLNESVYRYQWQHFKGSRDMLSFDLPGHGRSVYQGNIDLTPWYFINTASALLAHFKIKEFVAIGNSLGGAISLGLNRSDSDKLKGLFLLDSLTPYGLRTGVFKRIGGAISVIPLKERSSNFFTRYLPIKTVLKFAFLTGLDKSLSALKKEKLDAYLSKTYTQPAYVEAFLSTARFMRQWDFLEDEYKHIEVPTHIVWGKNDHTLPVRSAEDLNKKIADSELSIVDDTGHLPQLERPGTINGLLEKFLETRVDNPSDG